MGIVFRQSVKSSLVILFGALLGGIVIFLSQKLLPQQLFGFSRTFTTLAATAGQLLMFGMNSTLGVYIHKYNAEDPKRKLLITCSIIIPFFLFVLATGVFLLLHDSFIHLYPSIDLPFFKRYYLWLPVYSLVFLYQVILEQYLASQMKVAISLFLREIIIRILNIGLIILFAIGKIDFDVFIIGSVLIYVVPISIALFIAAKTEGFGFSTNWRLFNTDEIKELVHFTWYHILLSLSLILMGSIDTIMLGTLSKEGVSSVAGYAIAIFIISFLQIPYKAMTSATFPVMAQAYKSDDMEKVKDVFNRSGINIFIASLVMCLLIGCNLHNVVAVLQKGYESIAALVLIMMIGRLADMATGLNNEILSISRYYKIGFYLSLLLVALMIVLNYIFIPQYGIYGAAWSTSIAYLLFNAGKLYYVWRKLNLLPFNNKTWLAIFAALIALIPGYFIPHCPLIFIDMIIRSVSISVVFIGLLIWWKVSPDLNDYLNSIRENKRLF